MRSFRLVIAAALSGTAFPAWAQNVPATQPADEAPAAPETGAAQPAQGEVRTDDEVLDAPDEGAEIVVTGQRVRGQVLGDIPPEVTLNPREIRALGASNVAELIQALGPQVSSGRGRGGGGPVILVNGRRISSFSEVRDLPPEAIQRVDILPEEVALQYGYRADQRVVNLVLRRRFNAVTTEAEGGLSTAGGRGVAEFDVNYLTISGPQRTSFDAEYQNNAALLESQRGIIQSTIGPASVDLGDFRTLLPETEQLSFNATHNRMVFGNVATTIDGRFIVSSSQGRLGLPRDDVDSRTALLRNSDTWNGHIGATLDGDIAPWRWNLTGNFDRVETDTRTERLALAPADTAEQINQAATLDLLANGPVADLWAGPLRASLKVAGELRSFDSESTRAGIFRETSLSRRRLEGQANFDLPITSTRENVLAGIGDLSANLNLNVEELSDFGTLRTVGYGVNWRPIEQVSFIASVTQEEGAPGINQLGEPTIATPNVRVFDFTRGETVDITQISGGNPNLLADDRRVINLNLNVRPTEELSIRANYVDSRIENPIVGFPAATAEIEAAFPDRFVRDPSGRLVSIDARPINYASSERREVRWGIDFSAPFGPRGQGGGPFGGGFFGGAGRPGGAGPGQQPSAPGTQPPAGAQTPPATGAQTPPAEQPTADQAREARRQARQERRGAGGPGGGPGGRGGGGGFGGFGGFGGGGGRMQFSLFHTVRLEDRVTIREGGPELDFLDGSAAGNFGGTPRHLVEFRAGLFRNGFGGRLEVDWQSGTRVEGIDGGDLFFSPRTNVNLRLFANLGQQRSLVQAVPFLRGTRISLIVDNLLDQRIDVRDALGQTPNSFQPFYVDPVGRSIRISLRKQFF